MTQIGVEEAKALLDGVDPPQLVDCRQPWEWELVHLPGARLMPLGEILEHAAELDRTRPVLVYCHHGVRSVNGAVLLEREGFRTMSMRGGIEAWAERIEPALPRY